METVIACAALVHTFALLLVTIMNSSLNWQPLIWFLFYSLFIALHAWGGALFWWCNRFLAVSCLALAVVYILGSIPYADFSANAAVPLADNMREKWFKGGLFMFVRAIPSCCSGFVGIECINLACRDIQNPKRDIPRGYVSSVFTQAVFCFGTIFLVVSVPPGMTTASLTSTPLSSGYMHMFSITAPHAAALSLPSLCASAFGRMFSFGRQLRAMGRSGVYSIRTMCIIFSNILYCYSFTLRERF